MRYSSRYGQALTEYGVILGTVCVLAIPAVLLLGKNVQGGFFNMLRTHTTTSPGSNAQAVGGSQPQAAGGHGTTDVLGNTGASPTEGRPTTSDVVEQPVLPQVSGANGNVNEVLGNTAQIEALAKKLEQSNPNLSNALYQLAQKGYNLASAMDNFDTIGKKSPEPGETPEHGALDDSLRAFMNDSEAISGSADYQALSAEDQVLVSQLTDKNSDLGKDMVLGLDEPAAGEQVSNNSQQIETCADGQCGN